MSSIDKDKGSMMNKKMAPRVFETFRRLGLWEQTQIESVEPYCVNGVVAIRKYRITFEEIAEPKEVLEARLRKLWVECDNHHYWKPLHDAAKELGITLSHDEKQKRTKL